MVKEYCDVCGKKIEYDPFVNEKYFKVKQLKFLSGWKDLTICDHCKIKIREYCKRKETENNG